MRSQISRLGPVLKARPPTFCRLPRSLIRRLPTQRKPTRKSIPMTHEIEHPCTEKNSPRSTILFQFIDFCGENRHPNLPRNPPTRDRRVGLRVSGVMNAATGDVRAKTTTGNAKSTAILNCHACAFKWPTYYVQKSTHRNPPCRERTVWVHA